MTSSAHFLGDDRGSAETYVGHRSAPELFTDDRDGGPSRPGASRALRAALVAVLVLAAGLGFLLQRETQKANDLAATVQTQKDQLAAARAAQSSMRSDLSDAQQRTLDAEMRATDAEHLAGDIAQEVLELQSRLEDDLTSPTGMLLDAVRALGPGATLSAANVRNLALFDCGELSGDVLAAGLVQARLNLVESTMSATNAKQSAAVGWVAAAIVTTCPQFSKG
jgi:hypothetical protein